MIHYIKGNLLESDSEALVNTVNTVGVMGKGIALQFKKNFPNNYRLYSKACKEGTIDIGKLLITEESTLHTGKKIIINFPTKTDWRKPSEYSYIEKGLIELSRIIEERQIKSIAIPPLGSGNGGLDWSKVKGLMEKYLKGINSYIQIYQPNYIVQEVLKSERVKLTPARAMLLSVLYDLTRHGEFVSEFSAEKIAYFLQRFGAAEVFKLRFEPNFYGPYSGKVKHVLYYLNGSYITGYSTKDKKPFDEIGIMMDAEKDVMSYLSSPENVKYTEIIGKTKDFLSGFYSSYALELLSTVDFIRNELKISSQDDIKRCIENWNDRKKSLFTNPKFLEIALNKIESYN